MAKVFIEESTLTNIGDAIRNKTGKSELLSPASMATEIEAIQTGGGEIGEIVLTENCQYACSNSAWNQFHPYVKTQDIYDLNHFFYENDKIENVPFEINLKADNINGTKTNYFCAFADNLKTCPKINNYLLAGTGFMFNACYRLNDDLDAKLNPVGMGKYTSQDAHNMFNYCHSLRKAPMKFLNTILKNWTGTGTWNNPYNNLFNYCYALDEVVGLYPHARTWGSNLFNKTLNYCGRLKDFTFEMDENGQPYVRNWSNQTIDLTMRVGISSLNDSCGYNSGITEDKLVNSLETYEALKDNPDWWAANYAWCRYNRNSAVNTINSLPDVSQGSGNTIKFYKTAGNQIPGGNMNDLTEEEIAVATAKGWTVTLTF